MRTINLYYVYDNINEMAITNFIPAANDLVAAIGFRDSYITNEEYKKKGNFKALDLVRFAQLDITEDGEFFVNDSNIQFNEVKRFQGNEIMNFIKDKMIELGIDDNIVEEQG